MITWGLDGAPDGVSFSPSISADGRYVAFVSYATNLTADPDPDRGYPDIPADVFLADLANRTITLISRTLDGSSAEECRNPHISQDGRYIIFQSSGTGLTDDQILTYDTEDDKVVYVMNVYRYDRESGTITLVTRSAGGGESGNDYSQIAAVSPDGDAILIDSSATNLTEDILPEAGERYLYLYEASSDSMTLSSLDEAGQPYPFSLPAFSPDGKLIYYEIKKGGSRDTNEAYIYNRLTGQRRVVGPVGATCHWPHAPCSVILNDGSVIVVAGPEQDPRYTQNGVYLIDPSGKKIRQISESHPLEDPSTARYFCIRAAGGIFAFAQIVGDFEYRLFVYQLDTETLTEISSGFAPEHVIPEIVLTSDAALFLIEDPDFDFTTRLRPLLTIYRYDVATGQVEALTDMRADYFIGYDAGLGFLSLPVVAEETGRVVYLTELPPVDGIELPRLLRYIDP